MTEYQKHDQNKPRHSLLSTHAIAGQLAGLEHGAQRYGADSWHQCDVWSRYYNAAMRHLHAWWSGEDMDPESNLPHIDHVACCIGFLQHFVHTATSHDDRPQSAAVDRRQLSLVSPANKEDQTVGGSIDGWPPEAPPTEKMLAEGYVYIGKTPFPDSRDHLDQFFAGAIFDEADGSWVAGRLVGDVDSTHYAAKPQDLSPAQAAHLIKKGIKL